MKQKSVLAFVIACFVIITVCVSLFFINKKCDSLINNSHSSQKKQVSKVQEQAEKKESKRDTYKLFLTDSEKVPFITLFALSEISQAEQTKATKIIAEYQDSYIIKFNKKNNKFLVITQNKLDKRKVFDRHNIEIFEVALLNGGTHIITVGFSGLDNETANAIEGFSTENENWEFDRNTEISRPVKHIVYNPDRQIEYTEIWNYDEKEPVKYEMKNREGHTISICKETITGETEYDQEHIFYDDSGQTDMLISIHFEGANITRITYYNINDKENSFTIMSEYNDGLKTSEKIYNSDYSMISNINAEYTDGQISQLELLKDNQKKEIIKR